MSIEAVRSYLKEYHLEQNIREFEESSATVLLAARAAGVIPARIAKSLTFMAGDGPVMIITCGDKKIDNHKYKERFLVKAKMLTPDEVVEYTGHEIGGVCPFALPKQSPIKVILDESLKRFDTIFPAAGSSNSCVEVTPEQLFDSAGASEWQDLCKDIE